AQHLVAGDLLAGYAGAGVAVESLHASGDTAPVYNLEVEGYHTYFVDGLGWEFAVWSHNMCNGGSTPNVSFDDARRARDAVLQQIRALPSKKRNAVSMVVGGVHKETGQTAVGIKITGENLGKCAEDLCVEQLGGDVSKILLSEPI